MDPTTKLYYWAEEVDGGGEEEAVRGRHGEANEEGRPESPQTPHTDTQNEGDARSINEISEASENKPRPDKVDNGGLSGDGKPVGGGKTNKTGELVGGHKADKIDQTGKINGGQTNKGA